MELSFSKSAAVFTQVGLTQTLANSYFLLLQSTFQSVQAVASGFSKVWSIYVLTVINILLKQALSFIKK